MLPLEECGHFGCMYKNGEVLKNLKNCFHILCTECSRCLYSFLTYKEKSQSALQGITYTCPEMQLLGSSGWVAAAWHAKWVCMCTEKG